MAILTAAQKATLAAELAKPAYAGLSNQAAANLLSAPTSVANPTPRGQVAKPYAWSDLAAVLSDTAQAALRDSGLLPYLFDGIAAQDRTRVADIGKLLAKPPAKITAAEATAVNGIIQATVADPNWPATVPGPSWARANFPGVRFAHPDGTTVVDQVTAAMVAEGRS